MIYKYCYESPLGPLYITADNTSLLSVQYSDNPLSDAIERENEIIKNTIQQLKEYFLHERKYFDLPLNPKGTDFQKLVWSLLLKIPYGTTVSYKLIAQAAGNKNASRAVGNANNKNPVAIIIPCHRVIASNNNLCGYAGGLDKKIRLLKHEFCENLKY